MDDPKGRHTGSSSKERMVGEDGAHCTTTTKFAAVNGFKSRRVNTLLRPRRQTPVDRGVDLRPALAADSCIRTTTN
jgi:hypothetical protein